MIVNGLALLRAAPIAGMLDHKAKAHGVSYGLAEAGYDIRIKQGIRLQPAYSRIGRTLDTLGVQETGGWITHRGRFTLASAVEEFRMPNNMVGYVKDKSTWARRGLSVFNTVIEPGWRGFLTLELVYHGQDELIIPAGAGIAQVLFHRIEEPASYDGKYQGQADEPVAARRS